MGCDIHSHVEVRKGDYWEDVEFHPFRDRSYGVFALLAGVRNYSAVTPIAEPRGLPYDLAFMTKHKYSEWKDDAHSTSWLDAKELLDFDYDATMEDCRYTRQEGPGFFNGGATCEPGAGRKMTWREFLPDDYFRDLEMLRVVANTGPTRVVFWFDN
jgi:hypothetical protein